MLSFQYPLWWILVCVLAGIGYAAALYYRNTSFDESVPVFKKWRYLLFGLRAIFVTLLSILLLTPLIKQFFNQTEKPIIVIARDNSSSIKLHVSKGDSLALVTQLATIKNALEDDYNVQEYTFGSHLEQSDKWNFAEKSSNISGALEELSSTFSNQNVGAVILPTDGIYNEGSNPVYAHGNWMVPMLPIALGDTMLYRDVVLQKLYYNKICYLGDQLSVKADLLANACSGEQVTVEAQEIDKDGKSQSLFSKMIKIGSGKFNTSFDFILSGQVAGVHHYRVSATALKNEITTANNVLDFYVEVLTARQKILLLAHAPHPDLAAIKELIEENNNYECTIAFAENFSANLNEYSLIILHQLPSNYYPSAVFQAAKAGHIPLMYILGQSTSLASFNQVQQVVQINGNGADNEVQAAINKDFSAFTTDDAFQKAIEEMPPLHSPFGTYKLSPTATILAWQKVGNTKTSLPLIALGNSSEDKSAVVCGEGFWRWKFYEYQQHQNHTQTAELLNKLIQYLIVKQDRKQFKAYPLKNIFNENESINFEATLYNQNYEFVSTPDVSIAITNKEGKNYNYTFSKNDRSYSLNVGGLPVGNYAYKAKTFFNEKNLEASGVFAVAPFQLEASQTTADHEMLSLLAQKTGGKMFYPAQADSVVSWIKRSETIKPVVYSSHRTTPILNLKWIFFLLLLLLSGEWFIRKWQGEY